MSGSVQKEFLDRALMLSGGGSFSRVLGLVDSDSYSANASMSYRIGKLELAAGAELYGAHTRGSGISGQYDRTHPYYYVKIRRRIF